VLPSAMAGSDVYVGAQGQGSTAFDHADDGVYDESALSVGAALDPVAADGV